MRALSRQEFLRTPEGIQAMRELRLIVKNSVKSTDTISINHTAKFVERHIDYLAKHPDISQVTYLSNLRVMLKSYD